MLAKVITARCHGAISKKRLGRKGTRRRFWVRPGRTSIWWDNIIRGLTVNEEWKENFRMSKSSFYKLCNELRSYIIKESTVMHSPIDVENGLCHGKLGPSKKTS